MKTPLLTLSFLLFAFTTQADIVLDTNGKAGNSTYPVNVLKPFSEIDLGKPLRFLPLIRIGIIPTDTFLNIEFVHTPVGVSSVNWITVKDLGETWTVGIGGPEDHEGSETLGGLFKINKSDLGYKLSFLPYINGPLSGDIGTYIDDDRKWRLVVTNGEPCVVVFQKVVVESS
ncbi:hypothetical protein L6164_016617 [Bauhinia variegata]|uniref:Uncharacterized protein n=1 Tax=Bauhinia variegata TaxID=167791 RepID=A0ACB9NP59_BAUVA|nr:hypothetical protein L6164_016617 [Bauhinia variegata]